MNKLKIPSKTLQKYSPFTLARTRRIHNVGYDHWILPIEKYSYEKEEENNVLAENYVYPQIFKTLDETEEFRLFHNQGRN